MSRDDLNQARSSAAAVAVGTEGPDSASSVAELEREVAAVVGGGFGAAVGSVVDETTTRKTWKRAAATERLGLSARLLASVVKLLRTVVVAVAAAVVAVVAVAATA